MCRNQWCPGHIDEFDESKITINFLLEANE